MMKQIIDRLQQGVSGYFVDQAVVSLGNFLVTIMLGRALGPEAFGVFSICWLAVMFASSLQHAFLITPMFSLFPGKPSAYVNQLARIQLFFAAIPLVLAVALLPLTDWFASGEMIAELALPTALLCAAYQIYDLVRRSLLMRELLRQAQMLDVVVMLLQVMAVGTMFWMEEMNVATVVLLMSACFFLPSALPFLRMLLVRVPLRAVVGEHWTYGKWLLATAVLQWCSGNFFLLAGGALLGGTALGAIRMAQSIAGVLHVVLLGMESFIPVRAARRLADEGWGSMVDYLRNASRNMALLYFPFLLGMVVFAPQIISLLFGAAYLPYVFVLRGFAFLYGLVFLGTMLRFFHRTTSTTREIFLAYACSAAVCFCLATPIVSALGISGIVLGMILSQVIICGWLLFRISPPKHIYS